MGASYTQKGYSIGQASIHFYDEVEGVPESGSYINFENAPASWVRLDGSPPPAKMYIENAKYDNASKTFTGEITWGANTFLGSFR